MPLLKHPTAGTIIDVTSVRANALKRRGYTEATADDLAPAETAPGAVQPQPPIDARTDQPEPPIDTRPDELIGAEPIDTRPPNPLGAVSESVEEADGAGLDDPDNASDDLEPPARSAKKADWVAYATAQGVENADDLTKDELIDQLGD